MTAETIRESELTDASLYPPQSMLHSLGRNLFLYAAESGHRSFVYRYDVKGRKKQITIGNIDLISLAEARAKVIEYQRQRHRDSDPAAKHKAEQNALKAEALKGPKKN